MLLALRISSYGCTWEVWRALKKLELLSAIASSNSYASLVLSKLPACIHNSIYAPAKHKPILKYFKYKYLSVWYGIDILQGNNPL